MLIRPKMVVLFLSALVCMGGWAFAQEGPVRITEMKSEPGVVRPGGTALLSCRVNHAKGPMLLERVAAVASSRGWNTLLPMLYDDGTHGDRVPNDGVFSLEVQVGYEAGEARIVFNAVDKENHEVESDPIFLTIK